ncbi:MAG: alpha/beta hydrolase [Nanoarchaeota archaeon]
MAEVEVKFAKLTLYGNLVVPKKAKGIVLFAYGAGSSRFSPRENFVARILNKKGFATLLMDLLTKEEEIDEQTREYRFDIPLLAERLVSAAKWLKENTSTKKLLLGLFGASTGAAACLIAAARLPEEIKAVVSRGGRPDLARQFLSRVKAPTLLIVGGDDEPVIGMNKEAYKELPWEKKLEIVPGATHLFEEPGKLDEVAELAAAWFEKWLK